MIRVESMLWPEGRTDICPQDLGKALEDAQALEGALILESNKRLFFLKITSDLKGILSGHFKEVVTNERISKGT